MRKLKVIFLLIFLFSPKIFAQLYEHTFEFDKKSKSFDTKTNYFEVNHRLIFEYGLLFCITREESLASTLTAGYEFNIISKKLMGVYR
jgi:hypothetical protein